MADWIQAIGVIVSLTITAYNYFNIKKIQARDSVIQMLNLLDEFDVLLDDNYRFTVQEQQNIDKKCFPDNMYTYMTGEVDAYQKEFRANLKDLWQKFSYYDSILFWRKSNYKEVLNSTTLIQKQLINMLYSLQEGNVSFIQIRKERICQMLCNFADGLVKMAQEDNLLKNNTETRQLFESLKSYVDQINQNKEIIKELSDYLDHQEKDKIPLSNFYNEKSDFIKNITVTPTHREQLKAFYNDENYTNAQKDTVRDAVKREGLLQERSHFKVSQVGNSLRFQIEKRKAKIDC